MTFLLDLDGVLIIEPSWKKVEIAADGFMEFNKRSADNLAEIFSMMKEVSLVLTTTHRINYSTEEWTKIFRSRGFKITTLSKVNDVAAIAYMKDRATEIAEWINGNTNEYIIIDDDPTLNSLPEHVRARWVKTDPLIGVDDEVRRKIIGLIPEVK